MSHIEVHLASGHLYKSIFLSRQLFINHVRVGNNKSVIGLQSQFDVGQESEIVDRLLINMHPALLLNSRLKPKSVVSQ